MQFNNSEYSFVQHIQLTKEYANITTVNFNIGIVLLINNFIL